MNIPIQLEMIFSGRKEPLCDTRVEPVTAKSPVQLHLHGMDTMVYKN